MLVITLERPVMVRPEIELVRDSDIPTCRQVKLGPHVGIAYHEIPIRIVLLEKFYAECRRREVLPGPHDGGKELLLESEPVHLRVHSLLIAAAASSQLLRLLLTRIAIVKFGILHLVPVAFLKTRDDHVPVYVEH